MATIVTMDSNGRVLSPKLADSESELIEEPLSFYLDGTQPTKSAATSSKPPLGSNDPRYGEHQQKFEVVMDKPMREQGTWSSGTRTTAPVSDSDSSFLTNERTNSSSTAQSGDLSSPIVSQSRKPLGSTDSPQTSAQIHDHASSNMTFQDMYDDDFCNDQRHSNTPLTIAPEEGETTTPKEDQQRALRTSDCNGTPPTSLYPLPEHAKNGYVLQRFSSDAPQDLSHDPSQPETDESLASNASYIASPAFPSDSSVPKSSRPVLYSAIGSLEMCGAHSLKSIWNKPKQKGFQQFDNSQLIAPMNSKRPSTNDTFDSSRRNASPQKDDKSQNQTTQDRFGDSCKAPEQVAEADPANRQQAGTSPASNASTQPTPTTSHHQNALDASLKKMQAKIDATEKKGNGIISSKATIPSGSATVQPATKVDGTQIASSMRNNRSGQDGNERKNKKSVKIDDSSLQKKKRSKKPVEMFRPSCDAYTPRMERKKITYKPAEMRTPVQKMATTMGTLSRPNFRDALRRVAMLLRQHIVKIEQRFSSGRPTQDEGLFKMSMKDAFSEEKFATPRYKCTVVRVPMARPGMIFGLKQIRPKYEIPTEEEIYEFAHQLFKTVQLSSECSIVCLIYIERLMEASKVPLLASTWRPIFMCGLLLASKVWQDLSSWNIEFASVYPQFSLDAINRLELQFLRMVKWDLYISSSLYAKYYFALRSLVEKPDFRNRYNRMVGGVDSVAASEALKIQKRTEQVKEEALSQLSRSM